MELVDLFDRAMTRLTFDARLDVAVVSELHVLGQTMKLDPFDRLLLFPVLLEDPDALDLVVLGGELRVAAHAEFDRGNTRGLGLVRPRMAVQAFDLELARVMLVAEGNRLDRARRFGIPGGDRGLAGAGRRPLLVELRGNLDLEIGILFLAAPQSVGFADARRDQDVAPRSVGFTIARRGPARPEHENRGKRSGDEANQDESDVGRSGLARRRRSRESFSGIDEMRPLGRGASRADRLESSSRASVHTFREFSISSVLASIAAPDTSLRTRGHSDRTAVIRSVALDLERNRPAREVGSA